jgi:hypothetical protein
MGRSGNVGGRTAKAWQGSLGQTAADSRLYRRAAVSHRHESTRNAIGSRTRNRKPRGEVAAGIRSTSTGEVTEGRLEMPLEQHLNASGL